MSCLKNNNNNNKRKNSPSSGRLLLQPFHGILTVFGREARPSLTFRSLWSSRSSLSPSLMCYHCILCLGHSSCGILGDPISTLPPVTFVTFALAAPSACRFLSLQSLLDLQAPPQDNPFIIFIHPICFCPSPCSVVFSEMHSTYLKIHCFKL